MKILKIAVILLLPAIGFVGCKKSDIKPANPASTSAAPVAANENNATTITEEYTDQSGSRTGDGGEVILEEDGNITGVVASGDDDRDGGDKKHKKISR